MYDYAGMHFPNGLENKEKILALPSSLILMLATEARYHYNEYRQAGKTVIWRGLPRQDKRPAELKWNVDKCATEALNLWDEQEHSGTEYFVPFNELDLNYERGDNEDDSSNLQQRHAKLGSFLKDTATVLRARLPSTVRLLYPPYTPDHGDLDNIQQWRDAANQWDGLVVHAYDNPDTAYARLQQYLQEFPDKDIYVGEWNSPDPTAFLGMLAKLSTENPRFKGATYFAWHWYSAPGYWPTNYNVDQNDDLYALFQNPPLFGQAPAPGHVDDTPRQPMTQDEIVQLIVSKADEYGIEHQLLLALCIAESNLDIFAERWGLRTTEAKECIDTLRAAGLWE